MIIAVLVALNIGWFIAMFIINNNHEEDIKGLRNTIDTISHDIRFLKIRGGCLEKITNGVCKSVDLMEKYHGITITKLDEEKYIKRPKSKK